MADDLQVGRMAREVRRARKLSQANLAIRAGVGRETVSRLERGLVVILFMLERSTHRHLIERHAATFESALPDRQVRVRHWIADPARTLRGIYFLPDSHETDSRKTLTALPP